MPGVDALQEKAFWLFVTVMESYGLRELYVVAIYTSERPLLANAGVSCCAPCSRCPRPACTRNRQRCSTRCASLTVPWSCSYPTYGGTWCGHRPAAGRLRLASRWLTYCLDCRRAGFHTARPGPAAVPSGYVRSGVLHLLLCHEPVFPHAHPGTRPHAAVGDNSRPFTSDLAQGDQFCLVWLGVGHALDAAGRHPHQGHGGHYDAAGAYGKRPSYVEWLVKLR